MQFQEYVNSLSGIVSQGNTFNVKFFIIDEEIERKTEAAITLVLEKFDRADLPGVIYTCVKELMINATKANLKRILFQKNTLNIDNERDYLQGMLDFRNALNTRTYKNFFPDLKKADFWVNVRFEYNPDGIRMTVVNNVHITRIEETRLREKLKKAMGYEDIAQFYLDQGDEIEGAGMGIALIVMLLKGIGVDPALFRIGNTPEKYTFARIEIPFSDNFVSLRNGGNNN